MTTHRNGSNQPQANISNLWGLLSNREQTMARFAHPSMRRVMFQQRRASDNRPN
ncbi:MAG: hypothetical protein KTR27_14795 [Leptolyngbyaceae cyanobacterium MAG.088]|nr:hypothetical protein [Leptolyngbyaceae cyanobacterium MAG.088]